MITPGMAAAIRQLSRSVWSASAAWERSVSVRSRRKPVKTGAPPRVICTGVSSTMRSVPSACWMAMPIAPVNSSASPVST